MPAQSQISSGGATVSPELYSGRVEVIKAKILVDEDSLPIATKFEVNKRFNGQYFVNARFRKAGALPNGISWTSDAQGIRFFGVPQQTGTFEALFEGPYPNNFKGVTTEGNYTVDQCHPQSQPVSPGVQTALVFGWIVRFVVTTKSANSVNFGTAWRNVLAKRNPALTAYREEWGGGGGGNSSVPSAPQNLAAVPQDGAALITFNLPISDGGSPITGYQYQASLSDALGQWTAGTFVPPSGATQPLGGQIPGLTNGQSYTIRVRAVNAVGPGQASSAVTVVPSASVFATMRVVGNEPSLGAWSIQNSAQMARQGAPAGYNWTAELAIADPNTAKFKFVVGTNNLWDDPNTPLVENWGDNDLPGANGYYIGDPGGADINFSVAVPGAIAGQYRFSFNETTYAWTVTAVGGGGGGGGGSNIAPQIQAPNPWSVNVTPLQPFSLTVTASGSPTPTFTATGLPTGLSISSTGVISGAVTGTSGTATITATNSAGSDSRVISFVVTAGIPAIEISLGDFPGGQRGFLKNPSPVSAIFGQGGINGRFDIWHARTYPGYIGPSKAYWEHAIAIPINYALSGGAQVGQGLEFKTDALGNSPWRQYALPVDVLSTGDYSSPLAITARSGDGIPLGLLPSDPATPNRLNAALNPRGDSRFNWWTDGFVTSGNAFWTTEIDASRGEVAVAGRIGSNQRSTVQTALTGPGTLTFWWKISSQPNIERMRLLLNGVEKSTISGSTNWAQGSIDIPFGTNTVRWDYIKSFSGGTGSDSAWLDDVVFTPTGTAPPSAVDVVDAEFVTLRSGSVISNQMVVDLRSQITRPYIVSVLDGGASPNRTLVINFTQDPVLDGFGNSAIRYYEYSTDDGVTWRAASNYPNVSPFTIDEISARNGGPLVAGVQYPIKIRTAFSAPVASAVVVSRASNAVLPTWA